MFNIFSTLPFDLMIQFHKRDDKQFDMLSFLEDVESFILRYIPLSLEGDISDAFLSPKGLREQLQKKVKDKPPAAVAELTIELCASYLDFWNHLEKDQFFPIADIVEKMVYLKRVNFLNMAEVLWKYLYNKEELREELEEFLVLSHYYNHSYTSVNKSILEKTAWSCIVRNEDPKTGQSTRFISDKINDFLDQAPIFPYAFLTEDKFLHKKSNRGEALFRLETIIDMPILTGILSSSAFSKNAFIFNQETVQNERGFKLDLFLKLFSELFTTTPDEKSLIFNHYSADDYTTKVAYVYDQYILERLSGINFLDKLYMIQGAGIHPKAIIEALEGSILSPLPCFRFALSHGHVKEIGEELNNYPEYIDPWIVYIDKIIKFQVMCSLPIMDFIFHYLMALQAVDQKQYDKDYSNHYSINMMNYFSKLSNSGKYAFYAKNSDGNLTPNKFPFPSNKPNLALISAKRYPGIYLHFFNTIIQMRLNNLLTPGTINRLNLAVTNSTVSFLTNTLPSISDIVTE